jgi:hypothetical protein
VFYTLNPTTQSYDRGTTFLPIGSIGPLMRSMFKPLGLVDPVTFQIDNRPEAKAAVHLIRAELVIMSPPFSSLWYSPCVPRPCAVTRFLRAASIYVTIVLCISPDLDGYQGTKNETMCPERPTKSIRFSRFHAKRGNPSCAPSSVPKS